MFLWFDNQKTLSNLFWQCFSYKPTQGKGKSFPGYPRAEAPTFSMSPALQNIWNAWIFKIQNYFWKHSENQKFQLRGWICRKENQYSSGLCTVSKFPKCHERPVHNKKDQGLDPISSLPWWNPISSLSLWNLKISELRLAKENGTFMTGWNLNLT